MKSKTFIAYFKGNHRDSLGEFSNTSIVRFGAERVKVHASNRSIPALCHIFPDQLLPNHLQVTNHGAMLNTATSSY